MTPPPNDHAKKHSPKGPQSGILNRPPEHAVVAAFTFTTTDPASTSAAVERLRDIHRREVHSDLDDQDATAPKDQVSAETGELGFADNFDRAHLTVTVGFAATAFDKLGAAADQRPGDLHPIDWAKLGDSPQQPDAGDFVIQACSDDLYVAEHVVHRIETDLADVATLVWTLVGSQRYTTRQGRTNRSEGRAVNGFLDGTSNLHPRNDPADRRLVFVDPADVASYPPNPTDQPAGYQGGPGVAFPADLRQPPTAEPEWCKDGTYMVVRGSLLDMSNWDHQTLGAQEQTVGRFKFSGSSLDLADDPSLVDAAPTFASNQANVTVPVDSHVLKANPRRPEDADRRIFRRGYPIISTSTTGIDRGLLFVAFARTITTQFEFIFRAWMRNPNFPAVSNGVDRLFSFEPVVLAGGYYFVPPLEKSGQAWTWIIPTAA
jgi:deferrochelatase/peroxidase EfeB